MSEKRNRVRVQIEIGEFPDELTSEDTVYGDRVLLIVGRSMPEGDEEVRVVSCSNEGERLSKGMIFEYWLSLAEGMAADPAMTDEVRSFCEAVMSSYPVFVKQIVPRVNAERKAKIDPGEVH